MTDVSTPTVIIGLVFGSKAAAFCMFLGWLHAKSQEQKPHDVMMKLNPTQRLLTPSSLGNTANNIKKIIQTNKINTSIVYLISIHIFLSDYQFYSKTRQLCYT